MQFFETQKALSYVVTVLDDNKNQVFSDFKFPSFDSMDIGDLFPNTEYTIIVFYSFLIIFITRIFRLDKNSQKTGLYSILKNT